MQPKEFPEVNVRIAEHQDEFVTLPARFNVKDGTMTFCFELSDDEINRIRATREIWFSVLTYGQPLQPIMLSTLKEELIIP